ncbi:hypothetical protein AKG11_16555 [Shinella sp. SUS2]|nr:hypothetical protein AKG11_16555 [Shinella sp. SUS2]KOC75845.1 hypothetical protein AKG10_10075 [Shinella sp. GWS1]
MILTDGALRDHFQNVMTAHFARMLTARLAFPGAPDGSAGTALCAMPTVSILLRPECFPAAFCKGDYA